MTLIEVKILPLRLCTCVRPGSDVVHFYYLRLSLDRPDESRSRTQGLDMGDPRVMYEQVKYLTNDFCGIHTKRDESGN